MRSESAIVLSAQLGLLLAAVGLLGGAAIGAVGPGGVFVTIALFLLLPLTPAEVAGTASATFVGTGLIGSAVYRHSGEFSTVPARKMVLVLCVSSLAGAPLGARLNAVLPAAAFGNLLAAFVGTLGAIIVYREVAGLHQTAWFTGAANWTRHLTLAGTGFGVSVTGAMLGVGGPILLVPILVVLGVPTLIAVGASQVQSVIIAAGATVTYASVGAVLGWLVLLVGIPQLVGVWLGWRLAHRVNDRLLRTGLGVLLVVTAPTLAM